MGNKIFKLNNFRKTVNYLRKNGVRHAYYAVRERIVEERKADYHYIQPSAEILAAQRTQTAAYHDLFSIVVPAFETKGSFLREMIDSVRRQSYERWELIIADAGRNDGVEVIVREIVERTGDDRIIYKRLAENKGISGNTNAGIALAAGDYIALLDHDDLLTPDALYHMVTALHEARKRNVVPVLLYSDEDKYDNNGCYTSPHKKEKFNLDLILSNNYICHFMAVRADIMKSLQLRGEFDGAQDYDLVLRVVGELYEETPMREVADRVIHIPRILYHWRCHEDSTAQNTASKTYAYEAGKAALTEFCTCRGWNAEVAHSLHLGFYDIYYVPDILAVREDVGIVGGRLLDDRRRICGGAMYSDGTCMYEGVHREYSGGSTHRAVLKQDVDAVDIRCMQVRPELHEMYEQITGLPYRERTIRCGSGRRRQEVRIADIDGLICDEAGYRKLSRELSQMAADHGYLVLWNPQITERSTAWNKR